MKFLTSADELVFQCIQFFFCFLAQFKFDFNVKFADKVSLYNVLKEKPEDHSKMKLQSSFINPHIPNMYDFLSSHKR